MFFIVLFFVFVHVNFGAHLVGPSSEYLGALSVTDLGHGMTLFVNYTQYDDRLSYGVWFANPNNYAYWDTNDCLFFIVGTPSVAETKDMACTFQDCVTVGRSGLEIKDNCGNQTFQLEAHTIDLDKTRYSGLQQVHAASYTGVSIDPRDDSNILYQSVYSKFGQAKARCSNFQLGNGTLFNFKYFERDSSGHYIMDNFGSHFHQCNMLFTALMTIMALIYLK
jgi:hypothetical protein